MEFDEDYMIWADSFKEGEWAINLLINNPNFERIKIEYRYNFQPIMYIKYNDKILRFVVYGGYKAWKNKPEAIEKFLDISRPDVMVYNANSNKLILAIEETAAVPTGNQSLQRLDRVWWAAELKIPFVYLITEYGIHKDGNLRKNSIWPAYLGLKLCSQYDTPSLTMLFGNKEHPEDYNYGPGLDFLSKLMGLYIQRDLGKNVDNEFRPLLMKIILDMNQFILSHKDNISKSLPGCDLLEDKEYVKYVVESIL
tara:strand:- start:827 stop:1585 length:759 start_codon:yes stop_codon:yes gene_type:complete